MELSVFLIFACVYAGMILGNWPGLALDRTGIALLGAIATIVLGNTSLNQALNDIDASSLAILFSFMILSAQFYFSGFYSFITKRMGTWDISPRFFLLATILAAGSLSAVLINDIVCLAMAPLLILVCQEKKLNPVPFLLGLACASNIGSALTLIGNPQNMLIGQMLNIPFAQYTMRAFIPCLFGLLATWALLSWQTKGQWVQEPQAATIESLPFDKWQSTKGIVILTILLGVFLFTSIPREYAALTAAGCLLLSRQMASRMMLSFIDWQLLVLFIGLFIVNHEFNRSEIMQQLINHVKSEQAFLHSPLAVFGIGAVLSNIISNVPAVMLLLPFIHDANTGTWLALSSTLAGNMFIVGSIANIIVVTQDGNLGVRIDWRKHLRIGLPISLLTLFFTAAWLYAVM